MLFKNRKVSNLLEKWGPLREIDWDDETIKWIAEREQLDVYMTHISKTVSLGSNSRSLGLTQTDAGLSFSRASDAELFNNRSEWAIHGVMTYPKFIKANITFTMDDEQFGWFFYDCSDDMSFVGGRSICSFYSCRYRIEMSKKRSCYIRRCVTQSLAVRSLQV